MLSALLLSVLCSVRLVGFEFLTPFLRGVIQPHDMTRYDHDTIMIDGEKSINDEAAIDCL